MHPADRTDMESVSITESSYSLASEDAETSTLVDSASRLSLNFSESATLRAFQTGTLPVSPSQETIRGAAGRQSRMVKAAHRFMSTLRRDRVKVQVTHADGDVKGLSNHFIVFPFSSRYIPSQQWRVAQSVPRAENSLPVVWFQTPSTVESTLTSFLGKGPPFSSVTTKALLSCVSSGHFLKNIALSLFLKRYDLDKLTCLPRSDESFSIKVQSPLSFRGIELLVINQIHCPPPLRHLEIWLDTTKLEDLKNLAGFVELLPSVKELCLHYYVDYPAGASPPELIGDAARQIRRLLSALSTKGCTSLQSWGLYRVPLPSSPSDQTPKGFPEGEPPLSSASRTTLPHKLESIDRFPPLNSLGCATLAPPAISIPIFLEWTIESLNLSPIQNLSVIQTPSPSILPSLSLNALTYLSVTQVSYVDLILFLSRHPTIHNLYINGITDVGPQSPLPPLPSGFTLPNLHHLTAKPELILHWLQNTNTSSALPFLQEFTLELNEVEDGTKVEDVLKLMYVTLDRIRRLPRPATVWITIPSKALLRSLDEYGRSDIGANELPVDNLHFIGLFLHKSSIPSLEFDDLKLIPQWVTASFPSLKGFRLFHGILTKKVEDEFLKHMVGTCRGLETIEIKSWDSFMSKGSRES
ncbi:hypothetical protein JAAARDRAFT_195373 [Jaapia argillacea MUCL 33604]|uniref:F-box domain-containing protein n=1 Tax=Jaapia argillacea MUCL 33604 TaxID=933084 RepID=A0A067PQU2_9AGAM|nr:hypothetical protein JAAARDRAFT_195373 [Jaapia argillacea MUCL 33604]